jgi:ribonuclease HI
MIIQFGKYRNKTYKYILDTEPTYLNWLLNQHWFSKNYINDYDHCKNIISKNIINYNKEFIIYTDGSCPNNGKCNSEGGIGIHFSTKNKIKLQDISEKLHIQQTTNNITELLAIKKALELTNNIKNVKLYTDSKYSINVITKWYDIWIRKGLLKNKKNIDIIQCICELYKQCDVELIHVKAHTGNLDEHSIGNMIADRLAVDSLK